MKTNCVCFSASLGTNKTKCVCTTNTRSSRLSEPNLSLLVFIRFATEEEEEEEKEEEEEVVLS